MVISEPLTYVFQSIGWTLVHSLWQFSLITALVGAVLTRIDRRKADLRHNVLYLSLVFCLFTGIATFVYFFTTFKTFGLEWTGQLFLVAGGDIQAPQTATGHTDNLWWYISGIGDHMWIIGIFWISIFTLMSAKYAVSYRLCNKLRTKGLKNIPLSWECRIEKLAGAAGIPKPVIVQFSRFVDNPVSLGFLKPMILLPFGYFTMLTPQQAEAVILHELAHIRRNDYLLNLIQTVIRLLFFYHPAVWFLCRQADMERENACDDFALSMSYAPEEYARALGYLKVNIRPSQNFATMHLINNENQLLSRLKRLLGDTVHADHNTLNNGKWLVPVLLFAASFSLMAFNGIKSAEQFRIPVTEKITEIVVVPIAEDTIVPAEDEKLRAEELRLIEKEKADKEKALKEEKIKAEKTAKEKQKMKREKEQLKLEKAKAEKEKSAILKAKSKSEKERMGRLRHEESKKAHDLARLKHKMEARRLTDIEEARAKYESVLALQSDEEQKAAIERMKRAKEEYAKALQKERTDYESYLQALEKEKALFDQQQKAADEEYKALYWRQLAERERGIARFEEDRKARVESFYEEVRVNKMRDFKANMIEALLSDNLISSSMDRVLLEFKNERLSVNGKKLDKGLQQKYLDIIDEFSLDLGSEWSIEMTPKSFSKNSNN